MKINMINLANISGSCKAPNNKLGSTNALERNPSSDMVNFSGQTPNNRLKKADHFSGEVLLLLKRGQATPEKIEEIIKREIPEAPPIEVCSLEEFKNENPQIMAAASVKVDYDKNLNIEKISLLVPNDIFTGEAPVEDAMYMLGHEYTHILQHCEDDILKNVKKKADNTIEAQATDYIARTILDNLYEPKCRELTQCIQEHIAAKTANKSPWQTLDKPLDEVLSNKMYAMSSNLIKGMVNLSFPKYHDDTIKNMSERRQRTLAQNVDPNHLGNLVAEMLPLYVKNEAEAYQAGVNAQKKSLGVEGDTLMDILPRTFYLMVE